MTIAARKRAPRRTPLAKAKARFSEIVADAQHHDRATILENRGRAVAAVVPMRMLETDAPRRRRGLSQSQIDDLHASFAGGEPEDSAVDDLLASRR